MAPRGVTAPCRAGARWAAPARARGRRQATQVPISAQVLNWGPSAVSPFVQRNDTSPLTGEPLGGDVSVCKHLFWLQCTGFFWLHWLAGGGAYWCDSRPCGKVIWPHFERVVLLAGTGGRRGSFGVSVRPPKACPRQVRGGLPTRLDSGCGPPSARGSWTRTGDGLVGTGTWRLGPKRLRPASREGGRPRLSFEVSGVASSDSGRSGRSRCRFRRCVR